MKIGVCLFTKIGTKTSIMEDEFTMWNEFQKRNPDCEFIFIVLSKHIRKSLESRLNRLDFHTESNPVKLIEIYKKEDIKKIAGLSGIFTYQLLNNFFGGDIHYSTWLSYLILSYATNDLEIPVFSRMPDSEYHYHDYKRMIEVRMAMKSGPEWRQFGINQEYVDTILSTKTIDYQRFYFLANGSSKLCNWVPDAAYHDLKENQRLIDPSLFETNVVYLSDRYILNYDINKRLGDALNVQSNPDPSIVFAGFLKGSVAGSRVKMLKNLLPFLQKCKITIYGPGATDLRNEYTKSTRFIEESTFGYSFLELLNSYLGYLFIGKGKPIKYINKTVYDAIAAKTPVIVYRPIDPHQLVFDHDEFYFETEAELLNIQEKLTNPQIRSSWIKRQRESIEKTLIDKADPEFHFRDYCKPRTDFDESVIVEKSRIVKNPLFIR